MKICIIIISLMLLNFCAVTSDKYVDLNTVTTESDKFLVKMARKKIYFLTSIEAEAVVSIDGKTLSGSSPAFSPLGKATFSKSRNKNEGVYVGEIGSNKAVATFTTEDGETGQVVLDSNDGSDPIVRNIILKPVYD